MIHFLLPAYNEEENIEPMVLALSSTATQLERPYRIVIVDDGSSDKTAIRVEENAAEFPCELVRHERNLGPGAAFTSGFRHILKDGSDEDFIITMDADRTHDLRTARLILLRLEEGYEAVVASAYAPGGMMVGLSFHRWVLTTGCNLLYRILFPIHGIYEYTGFYRGYRLSTIRKTFEAFNDKPMTARGFASMAELLLKFRRMPVLMTEVPMIVRYDLKGGASKMKIGATIKEHLNVIWDNLGQPRGVTRE